jgi:hypothetical protein
MFEPSSRERSVSDELPKKQHYVPQFLLRNFSVPLKSSQICVFDKHTEETFSTNIKNVSCEKGFYDIELKDKVLTMEASLGRLEDGAAGIIKKIINEGKLPILESVERFIRATFIAAQLIRVKTARTRISGLNNGLRNKLQAMGLAESEVEGFTSLGEEAVKLMSMKLLERVDEFVPYFYDKQWLLLSTNKDHPLCISDNPVTLQNKNDFGLYGNLGLGVKGIEIYMPISKMYSICILCRSYEETFKKSCEQYKGLQETRPDLIEKLGTSAALFEEYMTGMTSGTSVKMRPDNVLNLNSLQVKFSTRFVYSSNDAFEIVRQMIKDDARVKTGPQWQIVN